jgi:GNAT superfamily N-acetyltransferase
MKYGVRRACEKSPPLPRFSFARKPPMGEWYVSYAWGDDTPEGRPRTEVVDRLCAAAEVRSITIKRDKNVLHLGENIDAFMREIGAGDRIFVILSDKYLRSPYCMFELSEIWRTSRQEGGEFLKRVRIYALPDAKIWKPTDWADWAIYWKQEHDDLDGRARQHGATILGAHGHRRLMQMQRFYTQVADILGTLAGIVQPRSFEQLERYGFEELPGLPEAPTVGGDMSTATRQNGPSRDDAAPVRGRASRNASSRRRVIVPVTIKPLSKVPHLREAIIREHVRAWPRPGNFLDPKKWGYLGDPPRELQTVGLPSTLVAVTSEDEYRGAVSIVSYDLTHELYRGLGPWMGGLLVHPNYRGKGIGESLVSECVQLAAAMGIERLYLFTEGRDVGVDWYRSIGWRVHVKIPDFWDGHTNEQRTVMIIRPADVSTGHSNG